MTQKPNGGAAFQAGTHRMHDEEGFLLPLGMSLRDYFAGQALANDWCKMVDGDDWSDTAEDAYRLADAMIAARGQGE